MPPIAIDTTAEPRFIDAFLHTFTLSQVLDMRLTSRAPAEIDDHLSRRGCHMILQPGTTDSGVVYSYRDIAPDSAVVGTTLAEALYLAPFTHVLDFDGAIEHQALVDTSAMLDFKALKMTRIRNYNKARGIYPFKSPIYVVSTNGFGPHAPPGRSIPFAPFPKEVSKVVVNVATGGGYTYASLSGSQEILFECSTAKELVVVFSQSEVETAHVPRPFSKNRRDIKDFLLYRMYRAGVRELDIKFTLVNVGFLEARLTPGQTITKASHTLHRDIIHEAVKGMAERTGLECLDLFITCLCHYRERVGDDDLVALETMAPETM